MAALGDADGAWVDVPGQSQREARGSSVAKIALAVVSALILTAVIVWVRFVSGASAPPVPSVVTNALPVVGAPAVATSSSDGAAMVPARVQSATEPTVDAAWLARVSIATGISSRALQAYAGATLELQREKPACHLGWNTLAGIGKVESNNGRTLTAAGYSTSPILGPTVGAGLHAEGPLQFMPATWAKWGADGNGDGVADPNQIDDAALATARYLCSYGALNTPAGWHAAVFGYNHLESYVASVAANANLYASRAAAVQG